ncbi:MAG TPA: porin family protein [Candidatus Aminicenantes bacterium]|nr:porin family protein [Candidatus Aminicenantes bacterium]HRY63815.1 porin family protein [Candidatus Aminicenantes bacterium]HRZ70728.1 porin family protein [Candidatus Aminicenantes bacterium]
MKNLSKILAIGAIAAALALPRPAEAGIKFGLKGGANIANVNGDFSESLSDWKSTVGFCGGVFLELNFGRIVTIQPEVLYTVKGADAGGGKLKFDYIEIPVLLKIRIPMGSVHPFVFAGPAFGWNLKAAIEGYEIDDMPTSDYSAVMGGGLQLGRSIHIDARYTMGLQKLEIPDLETIDLKNGVLSATIGLAF